MWSLVDLLSFSDFSSEQIGQRQKTSLRVFSNHRAAITSLAAGHSAGRYNIAISTSQDNTAIVWNYHTGQVLRTFLLPSSSLCVTLDPADRTCYIGYEDGSVQMIGFYKNQSAQNPLYDSSLQSTPAQLSAEDRWMPPSSELGAVRALTLSYDGMILLSGHDSGKVLSWNIARGKYASTVCDFAHPVTNLFALRPTGLPPLDRNRITHTVVKPHPDTALSNPEIAGAVPAEYTFNTHLLDQPSPPSEDLFSQALVQATFPDALIEEGFAELNAISQSAANTAEKPSTQTEQQDKDNSQNRDQQASSHRANMSHIKSLEHEINTLKQIVSISQTARRTTMDEVTKLRTELADMEDYVGGVHMKQAEVHHAKVLRQARKEEREAKRREAWFEAEKKGQKGDKMLRELEAEDNDVTSDTEDHSSDES